MKEKKEKDIKFVLITEDLGIWPKIVEVGKEKNQSRRRIVKREWRMVSSQLLFYNKYNVLKYIKLDNALGIQNVKGIREVRRTMKLLRKVWIQIGVKKTDTHEGVSVKVLLDSGERVQKGIAYWDRQ